MTIPEHPARTFRALVRAIGEGDQVTALKCLGKNPSLALETERIGATRNGATGFFFKKIAHYLYAGDTALHLAAAAYQTSVLKELLKQGADVKAKNRRGAEPLHYAVDGGPGAPHWNDKEQQKTISLLIRSGADPNAVDKGGTASLHRAVRNRCLGAVKVLIASGANAKMKNGGGTTPLQLAKLTTGRGGSGTPEAKRLQAKIITVLQGSEKKSGTLKKQHSGESTKINLRAHRKPRIRHSETGVNQLLCPGVSSKTKF